LIVFVSSGCAAALRAACALIALAIPAVVIP
jgi:hypothetical protein